MKHFVKRKTQMNVLLMESQSAKPEKLQVDTSCCTNSVKFVKVTPRP